MLNPISGRHSHDDSVSNSFFASVRVFEGFGRKTAVFEEDGIPYSVNEFWTPAQRKSHPIHEISYRACYKPQLPEFFISRLTVPGDTVFDPFMGRGTTLVQAALMGRRPAGNDVNPLSAMLARPRMAPPAIEDVRSRLAVIDWDAPAETRDDLLAFYHPRTLRKLSVLRGWLLSRLSGGGFPDPVDDWIRMVALNRLTGHSPGFFSGYTMPPNQAVSVASQLKINARKGLSPPERDIAAVIMKKTVTLLRAGGPADHPEALFCTGPASSTPGIADGAVSLVVTSPPFLDIVDYADDNWLRSWFAGIDPATVQIGHHRTEEAWRGMVRAALSETARVLRPGGHVAFEVGEVRNGKVKLERSVWQAAEGLPFERLGVIVNDQDFTKTSNLWGVGNNKGGTNTNRIVMLRRT